MSYSTVKSGFFVIGTKGSPVIEKSRQGNYALVFLKRSDANRYFEQMCQLRRVPQQDYKISTMPIHLIQRLLSHARVQVCVIDNWDKVVA
ncbi:hypothetical protein [Floridanema evergladense]|uniref:Uncharacterized protein n=1 Tax=Floridaenema evergladense BLCC-F167 TaxID=3153639 RepID=A0ABV4WKP3_9CYAN